MLQTGSTFNLPAGRTLTVGNLVAEGKTKIIYGVIEDDKLVVVVSKDDITAHNDASFTKSFPNKGMYSTLTTIGIFRFLERNGVATAFISEVVGYTTAFVAKRCTMLPLEMIIRRQATGSYLKRHPNIERGRLFVDVVHEAFLKTTAGQLIIDGSVLVSGLDHESDDPLIENPLRLNVWRLIHPKRAVGSPESDLGRVIPALVQPRQMHLIIGINERAFLAVESAFYRLTRWVLIDWKTEFGITADGEVVIGDVIDNDSWRMLDENSHEVSKELFRQGGELGTVADNYARVARAVQDLISLAV